MMIDGFSISIGSFAFCVLTFCVLIQAVVCGLNERCSILKDKPMEIKNIGFKPYSADVLTNFIPIKKACCGRLM